jgi:NAD-dependent dihydropyrimidine dehydrogenase PreA subunit
MAYVITADKCTACGSCADNCPSGAIAPVADNSHYVIDSEKCVDCGSCESACPSGAIAAGS